MEIMSFVIKVLHKNLLFRSSVTFVSCMIILNKIFVSIQSTVMVYFLLGSILETYNGNDLKANDDFVALIFPAEELEYNAIFSLGPLLLT